MHFIYSALLASALVLSAPWWLFQMLRSGKYRAGLGERLGKIPHRIRTGAPCIWVHAVSVGEVLAVSNLFLGIRQHFSEHPVFISTTTAAGQKLARQRFGEESVFYFPLDLSFAIRPWFRQLRPRLVVLAETEFWPNFLSYCKRHGAQIAIVNARISDRSLPGYRRFRPLLRRILQDVDLFLAQCDEDRHRLQEIGAPDERVKVSGNLKFDAMAPAAASPLVSALRHAIERGGAAPVLVCGSTMEGEERLLLEAFKALLQQHLRALLVLAPRHPERFEQIAALLAASGLPNWRRSRWSTDESSFLPGGVFLLDSIGELASIYALADLAFVGGSLVPRGGHNILEPAQHGVPILVGPHTENFRDMVSIFHRAGALRVVSPAKLLPAILNLLANPAQRQDLGRRAAEVARAHSGATERTLAALELLLQEDAGSKFALREQAAEAAHKR